MNDKTKRVFNGWLALSDAERTEFDKAMKEYAAAPLEKKQQLRKSTSDRIMQMQTGPLSQGCACCGR
jgi:hypothetical protein